MGYNTISLGDRIFTARSDKKLKQSDVCIRLGISQSAYSKIESGKIDITVSLLYDLSLIFDVSMMWLLGESIITGLSVNECLEMEKYKNYLISKRK